MPSHWDRALLRRGAVSKAVRDRPFSTAPIRRCSGPCCGSAAGSVSVCAGTSGLLRSAISVPTSKRFRQTVRDKILAHPFLAPPFYLGRFRASAQRNYRPCDPFVKSLAPYYRALLADAPVRVRMSTLSTLASRYAGALTIFPGMEQGRHFIPTLLQRKAQADGADSALKTAAPASLVRAIRGSTTVRFGIRSTCRVLPRSSTAAFRVLPACCGVSARRSRPRISARWSRYADSPRPTSDYPRR